MINAISVYVPSKRARKLHIGLFGYSRSMKGISLPRAIKFCAAFYSIGIPPELLGLSALTEKEFDELHDLYIKLDEDIIDASRFLDKTNLGRMPKSVKEGIYKVLDWIDYEEKPGYADITTAVFDDFRKGKQAALTEGIKAAAWKRGFLG